MNRSGESGFQKGKQYLEDGEFEAAGTVFTLTYHRRLAESEYLDHDFDWVASEIASALQSPCWHS